MRHKTAVVFRGKACESNARPTYARSVFPHLQGPKWMPLLNCKYRRAKPELKIGMSLEVKESTHVPEPPLERTTDLDTDHPQAGLVIGRGTGKPCTGDSCTFCHTDSATLLNFANDPLSSTRVRRRRPLSADVDTGGNRGAQRGTWPQSCLYFRPWRYSSPSSPLVLPHPSQLLSLLPPPTPEECNFRIVGLPQTLATEPFAAARPQDALHHPCA